MEIVCLEKQNHPVSEARLNFLIPLLIGLTKIYPENDGKGCCRSNKL